MTLKELLAIEFKRREVFDFPSESTENTEYAVFKSNGGLTCNCPGAFKKRTCKHIKWFYRHLFNYPVEHYYGKFPRGIEKRSEKIS